MKLPTLLECLLVITPLTVGAQTGTHGYGTAGMEQIVPNGQTTATAVVQPNSCPVKMQASHLSDGSMIKTDTAHPNGPVQRLRLALTSPDSRSITSATVNVRGWTARSRMQRAAKGKSDVLPVRRLTVPFRAGTERTAAANVWVPGLTAVSSVELASVTYDDGTAWIPAQGRSCQVIPDPLMLISNR